MIFKHFLSHQIKESLRSSIWQKQLIINIIIGFFLILMLAYLVFLGIFIDVILEELFPDRDIVVIFNSFIIYYLSIEFLIRFFIQSLPVLNIECYLQLPVKKSSLVHFVAAKSVFAIGNYLTWMVFIPFGLKVIRPEYGSWPTLAWIIGMIMLIYFNNFLATYFKRQLVHKPAVIGIFVIFMAVMFGLEKLDILSLSKFSANFLGSLLQNQFWLIIPAVLLVSSYLLNINFLRSRLYPDEIIHRKKSRRDHLGQIRYLQRIGLTGELISLELRLLWRHKRTRTIFLMAPLFLLYGLIFYFNDEYSSTSSILIFVGIFMTGGMMLNYTSYCFGYESNYMDFILANYIDFKQYLRVKYIIALLICSACYILTIPYGLIGKHILLINTVTFLYNIGFLAFGLIFTSTYSKKRIDLTRNASFNYQGMGANHWLAMVPAFVLPVVIYFIIKQLGNATAGLLVIGLIGLAGIMLNKTLLNIILKQFLKKKHEMAQGFRSS